MSMEEEAVNQDIKTYINSRFITGERLSNINSGLKDVIKSKLLERSQGMYVSFLLTALF